MAQKVQVLLVDDVDGGKADETVQFGLDGVSYEIDLSSKNAAKLRDALAGYVGEARRVASRGRRRRPGPGGQRVGTRDARLGPLQRPQGLRPGPGAGRGHRGLPGSALTTAPGVVGPGR